MLAIRCSASPAIDSVLGLNDFAAHAVLLSRVGVDCAAAWHTFPITVHGFLPTDLAASEKIPDCRTD
jgi:hypothetical protein